MQVDPRDPDLPDEDEPAPSPACERVRAELEHYVSGSSAQGAGRGFRQHLTECAECRDLYRATLASAARLGRALRTAREEETKRHRRADGRKRAIRAGTRLRGGRRFGLRLAIVPGLLALCFLFVGRDGPGQGMTAHWESGAARVAGALLDAEAVPIQSGDWCLTEGAARIRVEGPDCVLVLGADTQLLIEDPNAARVRLQRGELELTGGVTVLCQLGVVRQSEGRARIRLQGGRLELECYEGDVRHQNSEGARTLSPGETLQAGLAGALVDGR